MDDDSTEGALDELRRVWEAQAQADPLWAVLSEANRRERGWDVEAFMATGQEQIDKTTARFFELGGTLPDDELALDFGSGVGRLTQPLAKCFQRVIGVDISSTMAAVARRINVHGDRVEYVVNERPDLAFLDDGSVSLVFTHITLQHVPSDVAARYIHEFLRVVKPGGAIIFQLPSHYSASYLPPESTDAALAPGAMRARIELAELSGPPVSGAELTIVAEVTNLSREPWLQGSTRTINLGNHWAEAPRPSRRRPWRRSHTRQEQMTIHDDGRSRLPGRLDPGDTARVPIRVHTPTRPGRYLLQLDVVQEGVSWFASNGSDLFATVVDVVAPSVAPEPGAVEDYSGGTFGDLISPRPFEAPAFAMNAIPRAEVEALLRSRRARILGADEWVNEWHSFTYYVQAAGQAAAGERGGHA
ncbi:MAG: class I SAM-dependent methyltransferase [Acidimicrobiales bacterium]